MPEPTLAEARKRLEDYLNPSAIHVYTGSAYSVKTDLRAILSALDRAAEALGWFVANPFFDVAVGGNPISVEKMIADAQAVHAELTQEGGNV